MSHNLSPCRGLAPSILEERGDDRPPERLLQAVWHHQRLRRHRLKTVEGQSFVVLHPGFWNHEPGPDFRGAVVQFAGLDPVVGDVEIDVESGGWHSHRHQVNPNFQRVILHGVWRLQPNLRSPHATFTLPEVLDAPLPELSRWLTSDAAQRFPRGLTGQCYAPLKALSESEFSELLQGAARARLEGKAAQLAARARETGWEQTFWEGLFHVLGYKQNVWPMQRIGELRARLLELGDTADPLAWQARLLGVAGLLPLDNKGRSPLRQDFVRALWDRWWRERSGLGDIILPAGVWRRGGVRPANHPQRRLALAAYWLAAGDLQRRIERWGTTPVKKSSLLSSLAEVLCVQPHDVWRWHWTLSGKKQPRSLPIFGQPRLVDLAVNLLVPWLWSRAQESGQSDLRDDLERRYFDLPAGEDNALLKLARARLLANPARCGLRGAARQQAFLHILKDFCAHSNSLCDDCQFPELVRQWPGKRGTS